MSVFAITRPRAHLILRGLSWARCVHSVDSSYDLKYAEKLHQKAKECDVISSSVTKVLTSWTLIACSLTVLVMSL